MVSRSLPGEDGLLAAIRTPIAGPRPRGSGRSAAGRFRRTATAPSLLRAFLAVAVFLLAGGAAATAPTRGVVPPAGLPASAPRVTVVGDSLTMQAGHVLADRLRTAGARPAVIARPGQSLTGDFVQAALADLAARPAEAGEVVVVATAANDAVVKGRADRAGGVPDAGIAYRRAVAGVAGRFADRCVVVVNARDRVNPLFEPIHAAALDADLAAEATRWPNIVVADWAAASAGLPGSWFATDQLHFGADPAAPATLPSADAWAAVVAAAVARCPAGRAVTSS